MMPIRFNPCRIGPIIALLAVSSQLTLGVANAQDSLADVVVGYSYVEWVPTHNLEVAQYVLTISTPNGIVVRNEFDPDAIPIYPVSGTDPLDDGGYRYELRANPPVMAQKKSAGGVEDSSGRRGAPSGRVTTMQNDNRMQTGFFRIVNGSLINPNEYE